MKQKRKTGAFARRNPGEVHRIRIEYARTILHGENPGRMEEYHMHTKEQKEKIMEQLLQYRYLEEKLFTEE